MSQCVAGVPPVVAPGVRMGGKEKVFLFTRLRLCNGMPLANSTTPANGNEREQVLPLKHESKT
ncbi:MAG: hypothetical protein ACR2LR_10260 [Hassallia sp.]